MNTKIAPPQQEDSKQDVEVIEKNKKVVREFTRTFKNEHNVDGINHLFAPDFKHHFKQASVPGLAGFKEVGRMMNTVFPDVVVTEEDLIADEHRVVERSSAVGTHRGSIMKEPPTNKQAHWTEIHIYGLRDGKIAEHWVEWSTLELFKQIGVAA
jgi:predicted ester cyclase